MARKTLFFSLRALLGPTPQQIPLVNKSTCWLLGRPVRPARCTPVRCTPVRCTPVRCTPVRCTPVRETPVKRHAHAMHGHNVFSLRGPPAYYTPIGLGPLGGHPAYKPLTREGTHQISQRGRPPGVLILMWSP